MNLTIIKNFFASDKKQIEPAKIGKFLRRSFRMKRPRHLLDNREKRKSGKEIKKLNKRIIHDSKKFCECSHRKMIISKFIHTLNETRVNHKTKIRHFFRSFI